MFEKVIILGGTQLAAKCKTLAENFCNKSDISNIEVSCVNTSSLSKQESMSVLLGEEKKTLVLSIMNPYIIPADVVKKENLTIINLHHALLPGHRGRNAQSWALYNGEKEAGVTWHIVDEGVDTGKIIKTVHIPIEESDTSLKLLKKQNDVIISSLEEQLSDFINENISYETPIEREEFLHRSSDVPNNGELDINWEGRQISLFLRTMDFGAFQTMGKPYVILEGEKYFIKKYKIEKIENTSKNISHDKENDILSISDGEYSFTLNLKK